MLDTVFKVVITALVSGLIGYLTSTLKNFKAQQEAIKCLLRANMVNQYFVYKGRGKMPYYCKQSWYSMYEAYKGLNGNSFVSEIKEEIDKLETTKE